ACHGRDSHGYHLNPTADLMLPTPTVRTPLGGVRTVNADPARGGAALRFPSEAIEFPSIEGVIGKLPRQPPQQLPCLIPVLIPHGSNGKQEPREGQQVVSFLCRKPEFFDSLLLIGL